MCNFLFDNYKFFFCFLSNLFTLREFYFSAYVMNSVIYSTSCNGMYYGYDFDSLTRVAPYLAGYFNLLTISICLIYPS